MVSFQEVFRAQAGYEETIMSKKNVIGVAAGYKVSGGIQTNRPSVIALVVKKAPVEELDVVDVVPSIVDGDVPVDVVEIGEVKASNIYQKEYRNNIPMGVSIGHYNVTAGTLGATVYDSDTGEPLYLSNNHVFANSNNAELGDAIFQPGPLDMGHRTVANLYRYAEIVFDGDGSNREQKVVEEEPVDGETGFDLFWHKLIELIYLLFDILGIDYKRKEVAEEEPEELHLFSGAAPNLIDAALAKPVSDNQFGSGYAGEPGVVISGKENPSVGLDVFKIGRTTGKTYGQVTLLNATIAIDFGGGRMATFRNQIVIQNDSLFSAGGDSGSLIIHQDENYDCKAVGLLFAGSDVATIANPINKVLEMLRVDF